MEPDTYSLQVIFATFVAMDDSGSRGCWAGRKEEDSPSLAFLLNHLPLCATYSCSPNLLQNFLKVARSYCSKKLLLKLNQNDGNFSFFTRKMSMVKYYVMQFKTTAFFTWSWKFLPLNYFVSMFVTIIILEKRGPLCEPLRLNHKRFLMLSITLKN